MIGRVIGNVFGSWRDAITRGLVRVGVKPNHLSLIGMVITFAAGICYALGAGDRFSWRFSYAQGASIWLALGGVLIVLASACDILDGAVARAARCKTDFGAFLDSTLDRYSDFVVYAGIGVYYAALPTPNVTYVLLCMLAFFNSFMISYTRARAEDLSVSCKVGFWQRPERLTVLLFASFGYNVPAMLLQQGTLPILTAIRRINYTRLVLDGKTVYDDPRKGPWWIKAQLWRWPRMTWGYDMIAIVGLGWIVVARFQDIDPLRELLTWLAN